RRWYPWLQSNARALLNCTDHGRRAAGNARSPTVFKGQNVAWLEELRQVDATTCWAEWSPPNGRKIQLIDKGSHPRTRRLVAFPSAGRATSGHAAAAPPSSVMNSWRFKGQCLPCFQPEG